MQALRQAGALPASEAEDIDRIALAFSLAAPAGMCCLFIVVARAAGCASAARRVSTGAVSTAGRLLRGGSAAAASGRALDRWSLGMARGEVRLAARWVGCFTGRLAHGPLAHSV